MNRAEHVLIDGNHGLQRILDDNPGIRWRKPSKQRKEVHAGDLANWATTERKKREKAIDGPYVEGIIDGIEQRKAETHKAKESKPPTSPKLQKLAKKLWKNGSDATQ